ncbi:type II toxin-antitoxin system VapC family toxin [Desulfococcus sp.]|uniref:type II toxin-antitoxin system VapC family toxin n=1 Tax=Desulfococcus sp. TaxID=2025834 RepID=UPI003593DC71
MEDTATLIVPTICILEVFKRVRQQRGEDAALQVVAVMHQGQVIALSASIALRAAKVGSELKLPLADSVILATAQAHGALVWTQDAHFKDIQSVKYIEKT